MQVSAHHGIAVAARLDALGTPDGLSGMDVDRLDSGGGTIRIVGTIRLMAREELAEKLGLDRRAKPDDFTLVCAAWRRWGIDCPYHLTGDFSFLIWDSHQRMLFGARDPIGIKPLFYDHFGSSLVVSDSLEGLLARHPALPGIDPVAASAWLSRPFDAARCPSLRQRVALLPPAHRLVADASGCTITRYASLDDAPDVRFRRRSDYDEALRAQLAIAVADAVGADDRIGVHLSGGLDSSAIAVLAGRMDSPVQRPLAYCWQPTASPGAVEGDDQRLIRMLAEQEKLSLAAVPLRVADVLAQVAIDPVDRSLTSTLLHESAVQRLAGAGGVTALLSGWGGDQGLSYRGHGRPGPIDRLRRRLRRRPLHVARRGETRDYLAPGLVKPEAEGRSPGGQWPSARAEQIAMLTNPGLGERMASWHWAGRRYGIDYRYPLLDIRLIRLLLGLPPELFRPGPHGRDLARRVLAPMLPRAIVSYTDKTDPTRMAANQPTIVSALQRLLPRLDTADPERATFVDRARLAADIDRLIQSGEGPTGLILRTIAFLKLKD